MIACTAGATCSGVAAVFADSALTGPTATGPSQIEWALTMTEEELRSAAGPARSEFYADFIVACAACHTQLGAGPAEIEQAATGGVDGYG